MSNFANCDVILNISDLVKEIKEQLGLVIGLLKERVKSPSEEFLGQRKRVLYLGQIKMRNIIYPPILLMELLSFPLRSYCCM